MRQVQSRLSSGLLWTALLLATYYATGLLTRPIGMLFGETAGLVPARQLASWAALVALALTIGAAGCVAIPIALRSGGFGRRIVNMVPAWLLKFLAIGAIAAWFKIGTVGGLTEIDPVGKITFAIAWLTVFGVLSTLVLVPLTGRALVSPQTVKTANSLQMLATLAAVVAAGAMIVAVAIVLPATAAAPGGPGGPPGGAVDAAAMAAQAAMAAAAKQKFAIGGGFMLLFAILALRSALAGWRARRTITAADRTEPQLQGGTSGLGGAIVASLVLTAVVLIAIQPFRIPLDNPPATQAAVWDSVATAALVDRTCMDCHSNEGTWPWYSSVAPANWLTAGHVRSARKVFNLSELDKLKPDKRADLGERMARSFERGRMPTADYKLVHPRSHLTEAEATALAEGLKRSLAVRE